jgi:pimeloyl-ACP methyl ester carboxylesterase
VKRIAWLRGRSHLRHRRPYDQSRDVRDARSVTHTVSAVLFASSVEGAALTSPTDTPTVVLVHGGFADASFWVPVIRELQASNIPVLAPANPLRGLAHDAEYVASVANGIDGPVLLVGHSYGGAVITVAGAAASNAVGLVYVAAFALDEGEAFSEIYDQFGATPILDAVSPSDYPLDGGGTAVELTIRPDLYKAAFAADLADEDIEVLAVTQRPFAAIFEDRPQVAAWKTLPSWYIVATEDNAIPPDGQRHMAARMGAQTVEAQGASHSIALSQPKPVADLIRAAVAGVAAEAATA